jgi:hypothetical protein
MRREIMGIFGGIRSLDDEYLSFGNMYLSLRHVRFYPSRGVLTIPGDEAPETGMSRQELLGRCSVLSGNSAHSIVLL